MLAAYTIVANTTADRDAAAILLIEPGVPPSSRFLSLVRDALIEKNWHIQAPCLHNATCPMDGKRGGKWCHFTFSTETAPKPLRNLSNSVGLPKDRVALSFLLATSATIPASTLAPNCLHIRIASDPIVLPGNRTGFYGCSQLGLTLLETPAAYGGTELVRKLYSGALVSVPMPVKASPIDGKSGAVRITMPNSR
jgi:hypothetical protein